MAESPHYEESEDFTKMTYSRIAFVSRDPSFMKLRRRQTSTDSTTKGKSRTPHQAPSALTPSSCTFAVPSFCDVRVDHRAVQEEVNAWLHRHKFSIGVRCAARDTCKAGSIHTSRSVGATRVMTWEEARWRPRDIELCEALLSKRKAQSCCGRRPDHDGTLGFDKSAREPRIHTTRSAVNSPHTICQKIWHLIGAGPHWRPKCNGRDPQGPPVTVGNVRQPSRPSAILVMTGHPVQGRLHF